MPTYARAHTNLGLALARQGRYDEAIEHHTEALRIEPGFAEAHNNLANVLARQGKFEEATQHYTEALRLNPAMPKRILTLELHSQFRNDLTRHSIIFPKRFGWSRTQPRLMPFWATYYCNWGRPRKRNLIIQRQYG